MGTLDMQIGWYVFKNTFQKVRSLRVRKNINLDRQRNQGCSGIISELWSGQDEEFSVPRCRNHPCQSLAFQVEWAQLGKSCKEGLVQIRQSEKEGQRKRMSPYIQDWQTGNRKWGGGWVTQLFCLCFHIQSPFPYLLSESTTWQRLREQSSFHCKRSGLSPPQHT